MGSPLTKPRDGVSFSHQHEGDDCLKAVTNDHDFGGEFEWIGQLQRTVTCPECGLLLWACVSGYTRYAVDQRERAGPITQTSMDRNHLLQDGPSLTVFFFCLFSFFQILPGKSRW